MNLSFVIPGEPVAKGRPRLGIVAGHAMAYTPKKTRSYEDIVRQTGIQAMQAQGVAITDSAVSLRIAFQRGIPKSWSKKKHALAAAGMIRPCGKPDLDNLVKAVTDGLNGVAYLDDGQIFNIDATKLYSLEPAVAVSLTW